MAQPVKEYDTALDSKKRITIRGARTKFYHVTEKNDGTIELSPRELTHPDEVYKKTLIMVDKAVKKLKEGNASDPIDFDELDNLLKK
ncbi:MAG: hypothetical protein WD491_14545 [Balneolales bacterium]